MGTIAKIQNNNELHLLASTAYAICSSNASVVSKIATIQDQQEFTLFVGETIHIQFINTNTATNPTLNVNDTGAKPLYRYGTTSVGITPSESWPPGTVLSITYDGTGWQINDVAPSVLGVNALKLRVDSVEETATAASTKSDNALYQSTQAYDTATDIQSRADSGEFDAVTVSVDSSAGTVFLNKNISTTLTCTVTKGNGTDITSQVTRFTWKKKNADGTIDPTWNRSLAGNTITLTDADVDSKAVFICEVEF